MSRNSILKAILIIMIAALVYIAPVQHHEAAAPKQANPAVSLPENNASANAKLDELELLTNVLHPELESRKKTLEGTVAKLKSELACKQKESARLDQELIELELQYNRLMKKNEEITKRINSLTQAAQE